MSGAGPALAAALVLAALPAITVAQSRTAGPPTVRTEEKAAGSQPVTVDSDRMERFGKESPAPAVTQSRAAPAAARTGGKAAERPREDRSQPVTVNSDRMERFGKESLVIFTGNVVARQDNSVQYADRMEVYLDEKGDRILRTVSTGNVRIITKDCRTGTAARAEYHDLEQRVVLIGGARVWQDDNVVSGETITIYVSEDRSVVQGGTQERVKAVFFPRDQKKDGTVAARPAAAPCVN